MATPIKISALPAAGPILGSELVAVVQGGLTVKTDIVSMLAGLVGPPGPPGGPGPPGPPGPSTGLEKDVTAATSYAAGQVLIVGVVPGYPSASAWPGLTVVPATGVFSWTNGTAVWDFSNTFPSMMTWTLGGESTIAFFPPGGPVAQFGGPGGANVTIWSAGVAISYSALVPGNWNGSPPPGVWEALERLAAWMVTNFGGLTPP